MLRITLHTDGYVKNVLTKNSGGIKMYDVIIKRRYYLIKYYAQTFKQVVELLTDYRGENIEIVRCV